MYHTADPPPPAHASPSAPPPLSNDAVAETWWVGNTPSPGVTDQPLDPLGSAAADVLCDACTLGQMGGEAPPDETAITTSVGDDEVDRPGVKEMDEALSEGVLRSVGRSSAWVKEAEDGRSPGALHGVQRLLDYNKQWAHEVSSCNPDYFKDLAKNQKPDYLWIGCSDSRVPANEIVGLHPGDVFVHRNIGNIFSFSDLNCLSALQFAVDVLHVRHVIVAGHYKCGGVTAAMNGTSIGLTDHWIMQVTDIKNRCWDRVRRDIPSPDHLNVLCELNVLQQVSHVVNCHILQRRWAALNVHAATSRGGRGLAHVHVNPSYAKCHPRLSVRGTDGALDVPGEPEELEVHGWVYSLDDGVLRPLISLNRHSQTRKELQDAWEAVFIRYAQGH